MRQCDRCSDFRYEARRPVRHLVGQAAISCGRAGHVPTSPSKGSRVPGPIRMTRVAEAGRVSESRGH